VIVDQLPLGARETINSSVETKTSPCTDAATVSSSLTVLIDSSA